MEDNVWKAAISYIRLLGFPVFPSWAYKWLIILGAWRIVMILSCISVISIPICKGKQSRRKYLWLIRPRHASLEDSTPYLVPNKSMMIVLCELLAAAMYLVLACLHCTSFRSPRFTNAVIVTTPWCGMSLLPTYVGIWLSGWGWVYTFSSSSFAPKEKLGTRWLKPAIFNLVSIGWAGLVSIVTLSWAILLILRLKREYQRVGVVIGELEILSSSAGTSGTNSPSDLSADLQSYAQLWDGLHEIGIIVKLWSISWIVFHIILAAFYTAILYRLFRKIKALVNICRSQESLLSNHFERRASPMSHMPLIADKACMALTKLREELRFLAFYNALILISVLCEVGVACFQLGHSKHLTDANWLALSGILSMVPSTFVSPTLLLQCWRIFTERSSAEDADFDVPSKLLLQLPQLPIFYERLLRWYDDPHLDETDIFHFDDTFAGLVQTPQELIVTSKSDESVDINDGTQEPLKITKTVEFKVGA